MPEFRSSNHTHQPVIEALALVARYAAMGGDWAEVVVHCTDNRGRRRVVRMVYEVVAFQALRDQLKCKEIWVVGADKWRNPGRGPAPELRRAPARTRADFAPGATNQKWVDGASSGGVDAGQPRQL